MSRLAVGVPDALLPFMEHNGIDVSRCTSIVIAMEAGAPCRITVELLARGDQPIETVNYFVTESGGIFEVPQ